MARQGEGDRGRDHGPEEQYRMRILKQMSATLLFEYIEMSTKPIMVVTEAISVRITAVRSETVTILKIIYIPDG